jgi:hypothetical protein
MLNSSAVLDLTFALKTRGHTEANVKSTALVSVAASCGDWLVPTFRSSCSLAALLLTNFGKVMGASKSYDSRAAFDLKSLNPISPRVSQGLQIGGTSFGQFRTAKLNSTS